MPSVPSYWIEEDENEISEPSIRLMLNADNPQYFRKYSAAFLWFYLQSYQNISIGVNLMNYFIEAKVKEEQNDFFINIEIHEMVSMILCLTSKQHKKECNNKLIEYVGTSEDQEEFVRNNAIQILNECIQIDDKETLQQWIEVFPAYIDDDEFFFQLLLPIIVHPNISVKYVYSLRSPSLETRYKVSQDFMDYYNQHCLELRHSRWTRWLFMQQSQYYDADVLKMYEQLQHQLELYNVYDRVFEKILEKHVLICDELIESVLLGYC